MNLLRSLVHVAQSASDDHDPDVLRTRILHNCAAAVGEHHEAAPIEQGLSGDTGAGVEALRLAARMHARTQDDFHPDGRVHVGTVVIPAVLAVSDAPSLGSIAAGYEVLTAVASAYSAEAQRRGYRPTGMFGPLGAAAAAGVAIGLDADGLASALALASTMSAGTNQSWIDGSQEWLVEVAAASRAGVDAARLAAAGVTGADRALEGAAGWCRAFFDDEDGALLVAVLGEERRRSGEVAIKPYPVSGIAQMPTDLAALLGIELSHRTPDRIRVAMTPQELDYPGSRNRGPFRSRSDSLMSVARCVALAYMHGAVPYRQLLEPPDADESEILDRLELVDDDSLDETAAVVTVTVHDADHTERGHGRQLLYPDWTDTARDVEGLARRSEASIDVVRQLRTAVDGDLDGATIRRLLKE